MQLIEFMQLEDNITLEEDAALEEMKTDYQQCKAERYALLSQNKGLLMKSTAYPIYTRILSKKSMVAIVRLDALNQSNKNLKQLTNAPHKIIEAHL